MSNDKTAAVARAVAEALDDTYNPHLGSLNAEVDAWDPREVILQTPEGDYLVLFVELV